jgi:4-amino-4-deoxy-L-arabinose transferase-like glycosyltransferase
MVGSVSDVRAATPLAFHSSSPSAPTGTRRHRLAFWRSPADQPAWARPTLLALAAVAGFSYGWGMGNFPMEPFYAAAVRSMGSNWKDFFFAAVDPAGTATLDKLPGAFWVQALSVRIFGFHYWAVALPQVMAGVLTVLVVYRVLHRQIGPTAGVVGALVMVVTPVTALVNRGNISDSLLVLLTVLAADATARAATTGRPRSLLMAGVWVGLAFQTKMLQAWLIAPALFLTYLVAAPPRLRRRLGHIALAGLIIVVVSLSWMTVVTSVPSHDRPYVDGTVDDSVFAQVFVYNGWSRIGIGAAADTSVHGAQPFLVDGAAHNANVATAHIAASPLRLVRGPLGRDDAWLLPAALLALLAVLWERRSKPRHDPVRAAGILWGSWLVILTAFFSGGKFLNSYYLAALSPAIAALCAIGLVSAWRARHSSRLALLVLFALSPLTTLYAIWLIPPGAGVRVWVIHAAAALCVMAEIGLAVALRRPLSVAGARALVDRMAVGGAALSMAFVPAVTTGAVVADGLGSFSTPYQSASVTALTTTNAEQYQSQGGQLAAYYNRFFGNGKIVAAVDTTALAAPFIMVTGREFLPIGGYLGVNPSPSLARLQRLVRTGQLRTFLIPIRPEGHDPRTLWVGAHCMFANSRPALGGATLAYYDCGRQAVRAGGVSPAP